MNANVKSAVYPDVAYGCCPACGHAMETFFRLPGVPANSCILVDSREEALAFPRGDIELGVCAGCGFICNQAFDPKRTEYSGRYEETQAYSPTFNKFHLALAEDLVERFRLKGKTVVEVGCGKGEFLALLCRLGGNAAIGYDPGFDPGRQIFEPGTKTRMIRDFYGPGSGTAEGDLVCCKMTLEHIRGTYDFVQTLREAMKPGGGSSVFIQVPESLRILEDVVFEDVYYEHCSYFTPGSLARMFRKAGFRVDRLDVTYAGQYLTLEGSLAGEQITPPLASEESVQSVVELAKSFTRRFEVKRTEWQARIQEASRQGPIAIWGSGSKAVAFLRATDPSPQLIEHVVDINPHRQGHYMPGTGQRILSPSDLRAVAPAAVIVMNPIYREEIAAELTRQGIAAKLYTL